MVVLCANAAGLLGLLVLPESPRMLLALGREDEAVEVLRMIARFNGKNLKLPGEEASSSMLINSFETSLNTTVDRSAVVLETLSKGDVKCNLALMTVAWVVTSFNFYLITFLANSFEQVYVTALCLSMADVVGYLISGVLVKKIGAKRTLALAYSTAALGGLLITTYGLSH